ncbi:MAG: type II toxin-antitoxin system RelE family toxin [Candidatus Nanoarchaeia archaeon]
MSYKILPTKEFAKDFKKLDSQSKEKARKKIEEVSKDPTRYKFLHYDLKGSCRVRVDKLRIIFSYDENKQELYLEKIVFKHKYEEN